MCESGGSNALISTVELFEVVWLLRPERRFQQTISRASNRMRITAPAAPETMKTVELSDAEALRASPLGGDNGSEVPVEEEVREEEEAEADEREEEIA